MAFTLKKDFNSNLYASMMDVYTQFGLGKLAEVTQQDILDNTELKDDKRIQALFLCGVYQDSDVLKTINENASTYNQIAFFAVSLDSKINWSKTELASITRKIAKQFSHFPVVVGFVYGNYLTLSTCGLTNYKQPKRKGTGYRLDKVVMLKDIDTKNIHRGHQDILDDLSRGTEERSNIADIQKYWLTVLNKETLNKNFYEAVYHWYTDAVSKTVFHEKKEGETERTDEDIKRKNLIRFLARMMFVWFIKEKKFNNGNPLIPHSLFNKDIVKQYIDLADDESTYYKAVLQNLFFATLNKDIGKRGFREGDTFQGKNKHYDINDVFRYKDMYKDEGLWWLNTQSTIPYLNGGLFQCLDAKDKERLMDYFSDNENKRKKLDFPNKLFFKGGDKNPGLIAIFEKYKFTIEEDTPSEESVALDPELLGRVFENLLGSYNPETQEMARNATGSFYTPKPIVEYMSRESIRYYLRNKYAENDKRVVDDVIDCDEVTDDYLDRLNENSRVMQSLERDIEDMRVFDPACGSGAFPMGVLEELLRLRIILSKAQVNRLEVKRLETAEKEQPQKAFVIQKGESIYYKTKDDKLDIQCQYLGEYRFKMIVKGDDVKEYNEMDTDREYLVGDLTKEVKRRINIHHEKNGITTVANLFHQGRLGNGNSFVAEAQKNDYWGVMGLDGKQSYVLWEYKKYAKDVDNNMDTIQTDDAFDKKLTFNQKLDIIEKNVYGADIQFLATELTRLRFFISLLISEPTVDEEKKDENYGLKPLPNLETRFMTANTLVKLEKNDNVSLSGNTSTIEKLKKELIDLYRKHVTANRSKRKEIEDKAEKKRKELSDELAKGVLKKEEADMIADWSPFEPWKPADFFEPEWMVGFSHFDVVIGNPPYIRQEKLSRFGDGFKNLLIKTYETFSGTADIYIAFYQRGFELLTKNGVLSYITSNKWMRTNYGKGVRKYFLTKGHLQEIIDLGGGQFESATVDTNILMVTNEQKQDARVWVGEKLPLKKETKSNVLYEMPQTSLTEDTYVIAGKEVMNLKTKIEKVGKPLKDWDVVINRGVITGYNEAFIIDGEKKNQLIAQDPKNADIIKPLLRGRDIGRYGYDFADRWLIIAKYESHKTLEKNYPVIYKHLSQFKDELKKRGQCTNKGGNGQHHWLELDNNPTDSYLNNFAKEKVVWQSVGRNDFGYIPKDMYLLDTTYFSTNLTKYHIGFLNSKLIIDYYIKLNDSPVGEEAYRHYKYNMERLPIPVPTPQQEADMVALVEKMLQDPNDKDTDAKIDALVYQLYGLTAEEIALVNNSTSKTTATTTEHDDDDEEEE